VLELTIPRLDAETAGELMDALGAINDELEMGTRLAARAERLRHAVIDAVASGAAAVVLRDD
jgi:hypothetical protein